MGNSYRSRPPDGQVTDLDEVERLLDAIEDGKGKRRTIAEEEMKQALKEKVRGQDHIIDDLVPFLRRRWGQVERGKPVASLLFLGPPGTGKSELAKALTGYLYGDPKYLLRFDCQDYSGPEAKNRLIGNPPGYVDAGKGHLTRPMLQKKERVILFDEITRAWSGIYDLFYRMLDEGQMIDASDNKEVDFTEALILFTSNAEYEAAVKLQGQIDDRREFQNRIKDMLASQKVFEAPLLTRFDRVYVFKPLDKKILIEVAVLSAKKIARKYGQTLVWVDPRLVAEAVAEASKSTEGPTREMERVVTELLGDAFMTARENGLQSVRLNLDGDGGIQIEQLD